MSNPICFMAEEKPNIPPSNPKPDAPSSPESKIPPSAPPDSDIGTASYGEPPLGTFDFPKSGLTDLPKLPTKEG
jgi:hypothetical protein